MPDSNQDRVADVMADNGDLTQHEIAMRLGLTSAQVRSAQYAICRKLGEPVHDRS